MSTILYTPLCLCVVDYIPLNKSAVKKPPNMPLLSCVHYVNLRSVSIINNRRGHSTQSQLTTRVPVHIQPSDYTDCNDSGASFVCPEWSKMVGVCLDTDHKHVCVTGRNSLRRYNHGHQRECLSTCGQWPAPPQGLPWQSWICSSQWQSASGSRGRCLFSVKLWRLHSISKVHSYLNF